jgi:hypothetical protein
MYVLYSLDFVPFCIKYYFCTREIWSEDGREIRGMKEICRRRERIEKERGGRFFSIVFFLMFRYNCNQESEKIFTTTIDVLK